MYKINIFLLVVILWALMACEDMNSLHQPYLDRGETIYIGAVDSVAAFPGNQRVRLKWEMSTDPRISELTISWNKGKSVKVIPIDQAAHQGTYKDSIIIDKLEEASTVFVFQTKDKEGHFSLTRELATEVFGANIADAIRLRNSRKVMTSNLLSTSSIRLDLETLDDITMKGTTIRYKSYENNAVTGETKELFVTNKQSSVLLENVKLGDMVDVESAFVPTTNCIDMFPGNKSSLMIKQWPVAASTYKYQTGSSIKYGTVSKTLVANEVIYQGTDYQNFLITLGVEPYANWRIGFKVNADNTIIPAVVKKEGTFQVKSFVFDQAKNYYDPVTGIIHLQYVVEVTGKWIVTAELHLKK